MSEKSGDTDLFSDKGFLNELGQIRAKSVLTELVPDVPQYKWTYSSARFSKNITGALYSLLKDSPAKKQPDISRNARELAQAWESLSRLGESTLKPAGLLNAAAAYELAGYQANAACLARQVVPKPWSCVPGSFVELTSVFLQRLFLLLVQTTKSLQQEPPDGVTEFELLYSAAVAVSAQGLSEAAMYFLSGRLEHLDSATAMLSEAESGFAGIGAVIDANLSLTVRRLLPVMRTRTTWENLPDNLVPSSRWRRYKLLLARGVGSDLMRSSSVCELWPSQLEAVKGGLLKAGSKVVQMPTSAGKTRISEIAMVQSLLTNEGSKCIYIAPYRALVAEIEKHFQTIFADLGFMVSSLTGTFESDPFEEFLVSEADVLIVTPEKLDLIKRLEPEFVEAVKLVVIDEGHVIQDGSRGIKLELLLTRLKKRTPDAKFVFVSAVVPTENLVELAKWLHAESGVLRSEWRAPIQRFAVFQWQGKSGRLTYSPTEDVTTLRNAFVPGIIRQQEFEFVNPKTGRRIKRKFPEGTKAQSAAELAHKFSDLGPVLVFCTQRNFVESVAEAMLARLDYTSATGESVPARFCTSGTRSNVLADEWLGTEHLLSKCLKNGIAFHHGGLPQRVRQAVETDFHERRYSVIIATNTLAQGVNLPLRTVIFHSVWRRTPEGAGVRLPDRDYWNIAGRAGRAGFETEGTVIHLAHTDVDINDVNFYLHQRANLRPVESALTALLRGLLEKRISDAVVTELLDAEVLAMLVEEGLSSETSTKVSSIATETFAAVQAESRGLSLDPLRGAFGRVATDILDSIQNDQQVLETYSGTGLRTASCNALYQAVENDRLRWTELLQSATQDRCLEVCDMYLSSCSLVQEMQPESDFSGSVTDLLTRWIGGDSITTLRGNFAPNSTPEELPRFIEDFFGYRLPWGISAANRIAFSVLGLEPTAISEYLKYFPSMVKFGVPMAQATWALSIGIPSRYIAILVAEAFIKETDLPDHSSFLRWIGDLDRLRWAEEFKLSGAALDDVTRAVSLVAANPLLSAGIQALPATVGLHPTELTHVTEAAKVKAETEVLLRRDYDNTADRNAIEVLVKGSSIGYLPRYLAQTIAPEMDAGESYRAVANRIITKDDRRTVVTVFP